jgi:hypothetical protein
MQNRSLGEMIKATLTLRQYAEYLQAQQRAGKAVQQ